MRTIIEKKLYPLLALAVFVIVYILPLGARPLFVPDEPRYGEIPREMIAGTDWVVPHLNGLRYFEKPVLGYWLHAGSIKLFGENRFALRFPSAIAVGLSGLLIFLLVRRACRQEVRQEGEPEAVLAALVFFTCFEVTAIGTFTVLDSLLAFFLTSTMTFFYLACESRPGCARERSFLVLAGIACGLAFLTKGFLAFAVPVLVFVPYLIWQGRWRDIFRLPWLPLAAAAMVALPWSILIHLREPDFWHYFFWNEHVRRFLAKNAQHKEPFWFFFLVAPAMFLPWAFVVPAAVKNTWNGIRLTGPTGGLLRFSLCWFLFPFLFFSASSGKILTYILPCFPPFAILLALGLSRALRRERKGLFQFAAAVACVFFALLTLALIWVQLFGYKGVFLFATPWKPVVAVSGLAALSFCCFLALRSREGSTKILFVAMAPVLLLAAIQFIVPDQTIEKKAPGPLLEQHKQDIGPETVLISGEEPVLAVCWFFQRDNVYLLGGAGELGYGLKSADAAGRLLDLNAAARLIRRNPGNTVLVARFRNYRRWRDRLPKPHIQDGNGPDGYVFVRY